MPAITPVKASYQLSEYQIKLLVRRLTYGEDLAEQMETKEDKIAVSNLISSLQESIHNATKANERLEASSAKYTVAQPAATVVPVLALHQID